MHRMGELDPWMDENFVRSVWYNMGESVNVKMIRDKFSGYGLCLPDRAIAKPQRGLLLYRLQQSSRSCEGTDTQRLHHPQFESTIQAQLGIRRWTGRTEVRSLG